MASTSSAFACQWMLMSFFGVTASQHSGTFDEDREDEVDEEEDATCILCGKTCSDNDTWVIILLTYKHLHNQSGNILCEQHFVPFVSKENCSYCSVYLLPNTVVTRQEKTGFDLNLLIFIVESLGGKTTIDF